MTENLNKMKNSIDVYTLRKKSISEIIHSDPSISGHCDEDYVFVDISQSKNAKVER